MKPNWKATISNFLHYQSKMYCHAMMNLDVMEAFLLTCSVRWEVLEWRTLAACLKHRGIAQQWSKVVHRAVETYQVMWKEVDLQEWWLKVHMRLISGVRILLHLLWIGMSTRRCLEVNWHFLELNRQKLVTIPKECWLSWTKFRHMDQFPYAFLYKNHFTNSSIITLKKYRVKNKKINIKLHMEGTERKEAMLSF